MRSVDAGTIDWIWIRGLKVMQARHMGGFFPWANRGHVRPDRV